MHGMFWKSLNKGVKGAHNWVLSGKAKNLNERMSTVGLWHLTTIQSIWKC